MRAILSPEQVKQVVADVAAWIDRHVDRLPKMYLDDPAKAQAEQQEWREATLFSIEQLVEIDELECYLIHLHFKHEKMFSYNVAYVLKRVNGRFDRIGSFTFHSPDFTHPTQLR